MKKIYTIVISLVLFPFAMAQVGVNMNYSRDDDSSIQAEEKFISYSTLSTNDELSITIKGMYNAVADTYIATFSLLEIAETAEEADKKIHNKIQRITTELQNTIQNVKVKSDFVSLVPKYDYEVDKSLFSNTIHTEKAIGFELRKSVTITYHKQEQLDVIVKLCAKHELYDLAMIDYYTKDYESIRDTLYEVAQQKADQLLVKYSKRMNKDYSTLEKQFYEGYDITYPTERYTKYTSYSGTTAQVRSSNDLVVQNDKSPTQFYHSFQPNSHHFVIHPEVNEPVIQIHYMMKIVILLKNKDENKENDKDVKVLLCTG